MFVEKRAHIERDPCNIEATIRLDQSEAAMPCCIKDLTECGAGLRIDGNAELPNRFRLALPLTEEITDERLVELRWRRGDLAGVSFVRSPDR